MNEKISDQWQTPEWLFDELNQEFNFEIDLCATKENSKCFILDPRGNTLPLFCKDYLSTDLSKFLFASAFMNPPYSNPKPFVEKALDDSRFCKIVCLVKCDPSTIWWSTFWDYENITYCTACYSDFNYIVQGDCPTCGKFRVNLEFYSAGPKPGCKVRFFPKRIKFDPPQQLIDSGEVWKDVCPGCDNKNVGIPKDVSYCYKCRNKGKHKWVQKCRECHGTGDDYDHRPDQYTWNCLGCKGKGYKELSGPTFSSALIIMDRRNV